MKKVLLIYPPSARMNREDRCQVPTKHVVIAPPLPPMDLMYMAAVAERAGCECRIVDYTLDGRTESDLARDLSEFQPEYLVVSVTTPTISSDLKSVTVAKEALPGITTIAKGAHFLRFNTDIMERFDSLDIILRQETEGAFSDIVSGKRIEEIAGITWRRPDRSAVNNPDRPFIEDLDSLPFPARHLVDNGYRRPDNNRVQGIIKVARGCPFDCFFCLATPVSGSRVRKRSPSNILEEVRLCMEEYKMRDFLFWSDIFDLDKKWVMELCRSIVSSTLTFRWATNTRPDTIDLEMATALKDAGCELVSIGVESGSQKILDAMGKKTTIPKIRETFAILKKAGLKTFAYYIIGLPWETRETAEETIRFAVELDSDYANFFSAVAFPGTRFFDYAVRERLFDENEKCLTDSFKDAYYHPSVRGHHLTKDRIVSLHREAVRRFYLRPRYMIKRMRSLGSVRELYNYARAAFTIIRNR